ncbi:hydroxysqualene dehydroxylase HpnE [Emcibacter sp. SYSU 3D8]|uniref:hydroxysqualene dehydroxylase HpnE n=1 Tax=Emcibacter sp. SYSU 3D8 TaxID=3133969 RepID=UPI0031FF2294
MARTYVIGAGLAGLSAALALSRGGRAVTLIEATRRAGGRCRSFHDPMLDAIIDNGNHLVMSGNKAAMRFLDEVGTRHRMVGPQGAAFPFVDLASGEHWTVRPNWGPIPFWIFAPWRRVPGSSFLSFLPALKLLMAGSRQTVADVLPAKGALYRGLWEPLVIAAINARPDQAAAVLMKPVLLETFARGSSACRPLIAKVSLAESFIDPAIDILEARGVDIRFGERVQALTSENGKVNSFTIADSTVVLGDGDNLILAVPPWDAASLLPELQVPAAGEPIVNVHFRLVRPPRGEGAVALLGVIGGFAHWIFVRDDIVSITISAAGDEAQLDADEIASRCWADVQVALGVDGAVPPFRVVKEKRATFAQDPAAVARRPDATTRLDNLYLAGDWTNTGLPATIEGAIRSGSKAAGLAAKPVKGRKA